MFGVEECRRKCNGHGVRRGEGRSRHCYFRDLWTLLSFLNAVIFLSFLCFCFCLCRCVTVIRTVTVMKAGLLLTADTLEPVAVWTAALHESPEVPHTHWFTRHHIDYIGVVMFSLVFVCIQIQILRGWLCWSFSCLCYRSRCCLSHSASPAVDEALCTSATPPSTRADRAGKTGKNTEWHRG